MLPPVLAAYIFIHCIASPACLKYVPRITDLLKPVPNADFWCFAFGCTMCGSACVCGKLKWFGPP
jgi:hypothetical protein